VKKSGDLSLGEVKKGIKKTCETIVDIRDEVRKRSEDAKMKLYAIDMKIQEVEREGQESLSLINQAMVSICLALAESSKPTAEQQQKFTQEAQKFKKHVEGATSTK
jgi:uncharacterized coiled-coil DUF342 family protein